MVKPQQAVALRSECQRSRSQRYEVGMHVDRTAEDSASYPDEEVDHEEDVEGKVDLLRGAVCPFLTGFHRLTVYSTQTEQVLSVIDRRRSSVDC